MRQSLDGTLYEGTPPARAVPTGLPTDRGVIVALVLVVNQGVPNEVVHDFVTRYGLVFREETARAADSQARWSLERDGRVTIQLLSEQSAARIVIPSAPPHPPVVGPGPVPSGAGSSSPGWTSRRPRRGPPGR